MLNSMQLQDTDEKKHGDADPVADTCARASAAQRNVMKRKVSRVINSAAIPNGRRIPGHSDGACASDARKRTRSDSMRTGPTGAGTLEERRVCDQQPVKRRISNCGGAVADVRWVIQKEEDPDGRDNGASLGTEAITADHSTEPGANVDAFDTMISTDDMVTDSQGAAPEDVTRLARAPLVSFTRAALGDSQAAWELAPPGMSQHENFGIDDILQMPMNTELNKDAFWGDFDYPILNQDTQYFQLHESRPRSPGQHEQPAPATSSGVTPFPQDESHPALNLMLSPNFGAAQSSAVKPTQSQWESSSIPPSSNIANSANVKQNAPGEPSTEKDKVPASAPQAPEQFMGLPWNANLAPWRSTPDMYCDVLAPEIETRILAAPQPVQVRNLSSGSSAIRIAPRDKSKPEQSRISSSGAREQSRSRPGNRPKRSRQGSAQPVKPAANVRPREHPRNQSVFPGPASTGVPVVQPGPMPFPLNPQYASAVAANPVAAAAAAATMAAAMAVNRNVGVPHPPTGSMPVPHPMAGPLLFAQGLPAVNSSAAQLSFAMPLGSKAGGQNNPRAADPSQINGEQRPEFVAPSTSGANVSNQNPGDSNGGTSTSTPMMFPGIPYNVSPVMGPGMMPVDPNAFVHMAQMCYAALTGAGASSAGPALSDPARTAFLSEAGFHNAGQTGARILVTSRSSVSRAAGGPPTSAGQSAAAGSGIPGSNTTVPKSRPIFIADDGTHVVVEQQAPAKLMRHPVLGRLQLQSKHQAVAGETSGAMLSFSGRGTGSGTPDGNSGGNRRDGSAMALSSPKSGSVPSPGASPTASSPKDRRKRLVWTPELHDRFVQAINAIGINQAVPKSLVQIMNVEGLTTEHVKSHLQKYRNSLRKAAVEDAQDKIVKTGNAISGSSRLIVNSSVDVGDRSTREVRVMPIRANSSIIEAKKGRSTGGMTINATGGVKEGNSTREISHTVSGAEASTVSKPDGEMPNAREPPARGSTREDAGGPSGKSLAVGAAPQGSAANVSPSCANVPNTGATQSSSGETETRLQMQERTMQLQFQLQVMVHRTVALQKQLQLAIEKQNEQTPGRAPQGGTSAATECESAKTSGESSKGELRNAGVQSEQGGEQSERNVDIDTLVKEQMQMQRELDQQTARVRHEIGVIQQRLEESAEAVDMTAADAQGQTGQGSTEGNGEPRTRE